MWVDLVGSYVWVDLLGGVICAGGPVGWVGPKETTSHAHICPLDVIDAFK